MKYFKTTDEHGETLFRVSERRIELLNVSGEWFDASFVFLGEADLIECYSEEGCTITEVSEAEAK